MPFNKTDRIQDIDHGLPRQIEYVCCLAPNIDLLELFIYIER
jgi:hypothetical protein